MPHKQKKLKPPIKIDPEALLLQGQWSGADAHDLRLSIRKEFQRRDSKTAKVGFSDVVAAVGLIIHTSQDPEIKSVRPNQIIYTFSPSSEDPYIIAFDDRSLNPALQAKLADLFLAFKQNTLSVPR